MKESDYSWTCPYCRQVATIKSDNVSDDVHFFDEGNRLGRLGLRTYIIVCPNSRCREFTIMAALHKAARDPNLHIVEQPILGWTLKPQSPAKPFPDYIPAQILQDYQEACLICRLSPKAAATLARRCLQGMIRDFWGISKPRLIDEINELKDKIDSTTWRAIDAIRTMGNIGAHMEKDINLIIDVELGEADLLVGLIEVLLQEWYIGRHEREEHMQKVIATAQAKSAAKTGENL